MFPGVPDTPVGVPATVRGITAVDVADTAPVPTLLTALTRNVYEVPLVKPVTVADADAEVPSANVAKPDPSLNSTT